MPMKLSALVVAVGLLGLVPVSVGAHHAFSAEFAADKPIQLKGTVTKMMWINPHAWIYLDVRKPDGTVEQWAIEGAAPNSLLRRGWTKEALLPGTELLIDGFQAKDGSKRANGRDITLPDGRKLFAGSSGTGAPDPR